MSIRNQPYLPLYVQDFLTDEKLAECSARATGVYIRLMCLMHKSDEYGKILLKQKDKQTLKQIPKHMNQQLLFFATKIAKHFPYDIETVYDSLEELLSEKVIHIEGDVMYQKRMVKDAEISEKRAKSGKKGGDCNRIKNILPNSKNANDFAQANSEANSENEIDNEIKEVLESSKDEEESKVPKEEKGGGTENQDTGNALLLPKMLSVWKKENPSYKIMLDRDMPALREIAEFITGRNGIEHVTKEELTTFINTWTLWCKYIRGTPSYRAKALATIAKFNLQEIDQQIQDNGSTTTPTHKNGFGKQSRNEGAGRSIVFDQP